MARKRALIVDDSKSARVILSRMLEKYDIEVDMSESAEAAIHYLQQHRPDAIFMDHLMPGMDGLQAVQAIKGNPQTATIPIMMYTSQEGELYVGQARALGAMGVLPKQVRPVDVSKVLYELHLLPDRRDQSAPVLEPVEIDPASGVAKLPDPARAEISPAGDGTRRLEQALKDQGVDLRRFVVASLDSFATRIISDVRDLLPVASPPPEPVATPPRSTVPWPWAIAAGLAAVAAVAFGILWSQQGEQVNDLRRQVAALEAGNAELRRSQQDLGETLKDMSNSLSAAAPLASAGFGVPVAGASGMASTVRTELVPYGEAPLERSRLDVLREMLGKLEAQGFRGVVRVTSFAGNFCLTGGSSDGFTLAAPATPVSKCDLVGNPFEESQPAGQRQSVAFANLVNGVHQRSGGTITVTVDNTGTRAAVAYPPRSEATSAADWNKAASANNRVEYSVEPGAG
ncbi:MAG: response regulator [Steroidobacteraceae bacterium]